MINRLMLAIGAFVMTAVISAALVSNRANGPTMSPGVAGGEAVIAIVVGLIAGWLTWRHHPARADDKRSLPTDDDRTQPDSADGSGRGALRVRHLLICGLTVFLAMALVSGVIDPGSGAGRWLPSSANFAPGTLIASFVAALLFRDSAKARREPFRRAPAATARRPAPFDSVARYAGDLGSAAVGRALSSTSNGLRYAYRGLGRFRAGGTDASDQIDWTMLSGLILIGHLFLALALARNAGPAYFVAGASFGTAAALAYDRRLGDVVRLRAFPGIGEIALLALCWTMLLGVITTIGMVATPAWPTANSPIAMNVTIIGRVLDVTVAMLAALPLFAAIVREAPESAGSRPLWPLCTALVAGFVVQFLVGLTWSSLTAPAFVSYRQWSEVLTAPATLPPLALILGASGASWWQALTAHRRDGFDWRPLYPAARQAFVAMAAIGALSSLAYSFAPVSDWEAMSETAIAVNAVIWIVIVRRVKAARPANTYRMIAGWVFIGLAYGVTLSVAASVGAGREWAPILIIFTLPVAIAVWSFTFKMFPAMLGWVLDSDAT